MVLALQFALARRGLAVGRGLLRRWSSSRRSPCSGARRVQISSSLAVSSSGFFFSGFFSGFFFGFTSAFFDFFLGLAVLPRPSSEGPCIGSGSSGFGSSFFSSFLVLRLGRRRLAALASLAAVFTSSATFGVGRRPSSRLRPSSAPASRPASVQRSLAWPSACWHRRSWKYRPDRILRLHLDTCRTGQHHQCGDEDRRVQHRGM